MSKKTAAEQKWCKKQLYHFFAHIQLSPNCLLLSSFSYQLLPNTFSPKRENSRPVDEQQNPSNKTANYLIASYIRGD